MFVFLAIVACHSAADGKPPSVDTGSTSDSGGDTSAACVSDTMVAFDECGATLGAAVSARIVVTGGNDSGLLAIHQVTVLHTQDELEAFWSASGLAIEGVALPTVDFASEQVVAYAGDTASCHGTSSVAGFYENRDDTAALVAQVSVYDRCETCDTGAVWALGVWVTRVGDISSCEVGLRCSPCP